MWLIIILFGISCTLADVRDDYKQFVKMNFFDIYFSDQEELLDLFHEIMDDEPKTVYEFDELCSTVEAVLTQQGQPEYGINLVLAMLEGFSPNVKANDEAVHMIHKYLELFRKHYPLDSSYLLSLIRHLTSPTPESAMEVGVVLKLIETKLGVGNEDLRTVQSSVTRATQMFKDGRTKSVPPPPEPDELPEQCNTTECNKIKDEIYAFAEERIINQTLKRHPVAMAAAIKLMRASELAWRTAEIEYDKVIPANQKISGGDYERLRLATLPIHLVIFEQQLKSLLSALKHAVATANVDVDGFYAWDLGYILMITNVDPIRRRMAQMESHERIRRDETLSPEDKALMNGFTKNMTINFEGPLPPLPHKLYPTCAPH